MPLLRSLRNRAGDCDRLRRPASLLLLSMLALDADGLRLFWHRTLDYQLGRVTPLSIWTIGQLPPRLADMHWLQQALQVAVVVGCLLLAVFPRGRKDAVAGGRAGAPRR